MLRRRRFVHNVDFHVPGNKFSAKDRYMMPYILLSGGDNKVPALRLFILIVSMLCAGCIPVVDRSPVAFDLPQHFSASGEILPGTKWWVDLQDPTLNALIDQSLTDNFSLLAARERILAAAAAKSQTAAALFPSLDGEGGFSSTRNYQKDQTTEQYTLGLSASYELDLWNRLRSLTDAADLELRATEADYQAAAISLSAEVASTWYRLTEKRLQQELLYSQKETNNKILTLIDLQFRTGRVPITDVLQQKQLVETNNGDLSALKAEIQVLVNQLALLQGAVPSTFTPPPADDLPQLPALPATGIPAQTLTSRPDLQSSFLKLQAADKQVSAAIADRYPRLAITGDISTSANRARDLFDNWFTTLAGNLFGPLFDAGARKAAVRQKEAIAGQLFNIYRQETLQAISEVENSLVQEKQQFEVLTSLRRRLELATETVTRLSVRYRQGVADYQEVLLALRSKQGLEQAILNSRRQLLEFRISLHRAISGRLPAAPMQKNENQHNSLFDTISTSSGDSVQ